METRTRLIDVQGEELKQLLATLRSRRQFHPNTPVLRIHLKRLGLEQSDTAGLSREILAQQLYKSLPPNHALLDFSHLTPRQRNKTERELRMLEETALQAYYFLAQELASHERGGLSVSDHTHLLPQFDLESNLDSPEYRFFVIAYLLWALAAPALTAYAFTQFMAAAGLFS